MSDTALPVPPLQASMLQHAVRLSLRAGREQDLTRMTDLAAGSAAAWATHRLIERLIEVDPAAAGFIEELTDDLEMVGDDAAADALNLGLPVDEWIAAEAPRQTAPAEDLLGAVRRSPDGELLAILWPSARDPWRWITTASWTATGYETDETVAGWPLVGAVPGSPAAGQPLTDTSEVTR